MSGRRLTARRRGKLEAIECGGERRRRRAIDPEAITPATTLAKIRAKSNAEIAVRAHMDPVVLKGGETVKSLSAAFLADLEEDWRLHGKEIFPVLRAKFPQAYFQGILSLARILKWDVDPTGAFNRTLSPEEIMDKLEERVGPEGRKLLESFLRQVNELQARQQLEAQAQNGRKRG
jgi:hypothetical protein